MKNDNNKVTVGQAVGNTVATGVDTTISLGRKLWSWTKDTAQTLKEKHEARKKAKEDELVDKIANRMKESYSCEIDPKAKQALRDEIAAELHRKIQEVKAKRA